MTKSSSLPMGERKGFSTLLTKNTIAASARLKRVVVSVGLGAFIVESVGPGTYRTTESCSVP